MPTTCTTYMLILGGELAILLEVPKGSLKFSKSKFSLRLSDAGMDVALICGEFCILLEAENKI